MASLRFQFRGIDYKTPIPGGSIEVQGVATFPADGSVHDVVAGTYSATAHVPAGYALMVPNGYYWKTETADGTGYFALCSQTASTVCVSNDNVNPTNLTVRDGASVLNTTVFVLVVLCGTFGTAPCTAPPVMSNVKFLSFHNASNTSILVSGGSYTVDGVGTFPADGSAQSIPSGPHTVTANPPSGYTLFLSTNWTAYTPSGVDYRQTCPSNFVIYPICFSGGFNVNPASITFQGDGSIAAPGVSGSPTTGTKTVTITAMVTGGFPMPSVTFHFVQDAIEVVGNLVSIDAGQVTLNHAITHSWSVATGHTVQIVMHLENPLGAVDVSSSVVNV